MKNLLYIGNKLSKKGKTITSIETLGGFLKKEGNKVITVSNKQNKFLRLMDMLWATYKYRKIVDYVLIDTYSTQNFYYAILTAKLCRKLKLKYIPMLRGGSLINRLQNNKKMSAVLFNNAYKNVAPSLYTKSIFKDYGYTSLVCIPNTIEIENYKFRKREIDKIKILWVRSFSEIYNPGLAVKVIHGLKKMNVKVDLCMIGPDNDGTLLETKSLAKQLNVEVEFTGKLNKLDWIKKAEDFNIFINTSNVDNMPVSVIEAMALGLPVVSTNVGGMPYLISDQKEGLLVNKNDEKDMIDAILKIKNDPQLASDLVENARKKAETFCWQKNKVLWNDLLK